MDFPPHVPAEVQAYIAALIYGTEQDPYGFNGAKADAAKRLAEIEREITDRIRPDRDASELRRQKAKAIKHVELLTTTIDCLIRLARDPRMRDAYARLRKALTSDTEWRAFISAAWSARMDYRPYRERLKRTAEQSAGIATHADELARELDQILESVTDAPREFYSVPHLLRETDNDDMEGYYRHEWRASRNPLLIGPHQYAWEKSPRLAALLRTLAAAARAFQTDEFGMIGAALISRQGNVRTEYVRALAKLLADANVATMTIDIKHAIAMTATVVINDPAIVVTYGDVRQALA